MSELTNICLAIHSHSKYLELFSVIISWMLYIFYRYIMVREILVETLWFLNYSFRKSANYCYMSLFQFEKLRFIALWILFQSYMREPAVIHSIFLFFHFINLVLLAL